MTTCKQKIFGVNIDNGDLKESLKKFESFLNGEKQCLIFTPNPEILNLAYYDKNFKNILNSADLSLPDGAGIIIMSKLLNYKFKRLTGADFFIESLNLLNSKKQKIFLLGSPVENLRKTVLNIKNKYPDLTIEGYFEEFIINEKGESSNTEKIINAINNFNPSIIFVGLGFPKQEIWLYENIKKMPNVKIGMAVGGTFDFISGRIKRAPKFAQKLYLEWLWRLIQEPKNSKLKRLKRVLNAIIIFPLRIIINLFR